MTNMKQHLKTLWKDESGQGTAEYVLLIAIVVGLTILFRGKIMELVKGKLDEVGSGFGQVGVGE